MTSPKPKSRKVAWVVLVVVVLGVVVSTARPSLWDWVQYRTVNRVYWPDGTIRFEYKLQRWGERLAVLYEKTSSSEGTTSAGRPVLMLTRPTLDGRHEVFVFPGNDGTPDFITDSPRGNDAVNELVNRRIQERPQ